MVKPVGLEYGLPEVYYMTSAYGILQMTLVDTNRSLMPLMRFLT